MTQTLSLLLCEVGAADSTSREMLQGERVDGCAVEPTCMRSPGMGREGGLCREQGGGPGAGEGGVLGSNPRGLRLEREAPPARAGFPFLQAQAQAGRRVVGWPACGWGSFPGQRGMTTAWSPASPCSGLVEDTGPGGACPGCRGPGWSWASCPVSCRPAWPVFLGLS